MSFRERLLQQRRERSRLTEMILFGTLCFLTMVYVAAHLLTAYQLGRLPG